MTYQRNPRKRVIRGRSADELRRGGRRTSEELDVEGDEMPFVRLGSSVIGTGQDVVQRVGNAIIGGDFSGNARGEGTIDIQIERGLAANVASGLNAIVFGRNNRAAGDYAVALGFGASAGGAYSLGVSGNAAGYSSVAIGYTSQADTQDAIAIGDQAVVSGLKGIAIGFISNAVGSHSVALGANEVYAQGLGSIAVGSESQSTVDNAVAVGRAALASGLRSVAIGYAAAAAAADLAVIAATAMKMQTAAGVYEPVITTSVAAPVTDNVASWADVDRIGDGGVAVAALATIANARKMISMRG